MRPIFFFFLTLILPISSLFAISVSIFPSSDAASEIAARKIANLIIEHKGKRTVLGLATGKTMIPVYKALKKIIRDEWMDLSQVVTFNLDEYLDIPADHPQSFHSFMFSHLFDEILYSSENPRGIRNENIHFPSLKEGYDALIKEYGPIDIQILGIGRNGHIGFAEPGSSFESETMAVNLSETTREDNKCFFGQDLETVPKRAVTMGIKTILQAKEILLLAFGGSKAEAIFKTLKEKPSVTTPSSSLNAHSNASFLIDKNAAQLLNDPEIKCFINAHILKNHRIEEGELWISNGKIIAPQSKADRVVNVEGNIIAPGLIDIQINGGFGVDFARNPAEIGQVAQKLLSFGVTSFLPTVISSRPDQYRSLLPQLQPRTFAGKGAEALGIHLEGPFFSSTYAGAHNPKAIIPSFGGSIEKIYGNLKGVKLVTLAPELPGALELIEILTKKGILVSAGHSAANYEQIRAGIDSGIGLATHLFNAMTPYHHRKPAIIGSALIRPLIPYSLIVDGVHLSPETVLLAFRCNPQGLILISDATEALGLPDGNYKLGTLPIELRQEQIYLVGTNTLAGSNINLLQAVINLHSFTSCPIEYALEAASLKPAELLELYPRKGTLEVGADADFIILSKELELQATYVEGELSWIRERR